MICGTSVVTFDKDAKENPLYSGLFSIGGDGENRTHQLEVVVFKKDRV